MTWPEWSKKAREAAIWAAVMLFLFELLVNILGGATIWHRLTTLEHGVEELQDRQKMEEMQTNYELHELRQKAEQNTKEVKEVEQKVEKKKEPK